MSSAEYGHLIEFPGRRFDEVDQQFLGINQQFLGVNQQFAEVARQFAAVGRRLDEMDRRFTQMITELRQEMLKPFGGSKPASPTKRAGARSSRVISPR